MRLSARNQIKGTVTKVTKGATTSHVFVDIGNGQSGCTDDLPFLARRELRVA